MGLYSSSGTIRPESTWGLLLPPASVPRSSCLLWQARPQGPLFGPGTAKVGHPSRVVYFARLGAAPASSPFRTRRVLMAMARGRAPVQLHPNRRCLRATALIWAFVVVFLIAVCRHDLLFPSLSEGSTLFITAANCIGSRRRSVCSPVVYGLRHRGPLSLQCCIGIFIAFT